jgi:hypothetical protein
MLAWIIIGVVLSVLLIGTVLLACLCAGWAAQGR